MTVSIWTAIGMAVVAAITATVVTLLLQRGPGSLDYESSGVPTWKRLAQLTASKRGRPLDKARLRK